MNCNEFRAALEKSIEDRQPFDADIAGHGEICGSSECLKALAEARFFAGVIPVWTADVPEVDFADAVLGRLHEAAPVAQTLTRAQATPARGRAWQLAAAAAVMVGASIALLSPGRGPSTVTVASKTLPPHEQVHTVGSASEISRKYVSWAQGQSSLVADAVGAVLPLNSSSAANSMSMPEMPSSWFERLKPAQRRINAAIMFLEESVQMNQNPST
jgi:hypothetical protein